DGVLAWAEEAERRLAGLDTSEEAIIELTWRRDELAKRLAALAGELTVARQAAAAELATAVTAELGGLAMPHAAIEVSVQQRQVDPADPSALTIGRKTYHAGQDGVDDVELRLRPHAGAKGLPINKGASGGELSRVMLALEVVLAHSDPVPTLVFDEVDVGVGGRAAVEVGRRLALLARSHQVIVVTHLPQVAAFADSHLVVDKRAGKGDKGAESITRSDVRVLSDSERVVELARMLAGMDSTDTGRAHAEELLAVAGRDKEADARNAGKAGLESASEPKSNGGKSRNTKPIQHGKSHSTG
ncbi:MAG: DNA repair protein RecN, partial [Sciscionella sp.]